LGVPAIEGVLNTKPHEIALDLARAREEVTLKLEGLDSTGAAGTFFMSQTRGLRVDPSQLEHLGMRVRSGDASSHNPDPATLTTYDSHASLVSPNYMGELQYIGGSIRWPAGNYASCGGPSYQNAAGTVRWFTLKYTTTKLISNFRFLMQPPAGVVPWQTSPLNHVIQGLNFFVKIGGTGWIDANRPYRGYGPATMDGAGALDVRFTEPTGVRKVTVGTAGPFTGDIYLRLGFTVDTALQINVETLIDSFKVYIGDFSGLSAATIAALQAQLLLTN
jgi:hypothetical protein